MFQKIINFKSRLGKWFWVLLAILIFAGYRIIVSANSSVDVEVTSLTKEDLVQTVSTSGGVRADEFAQLAFQSGGKVSYVGVKSGDLVKKGQVIARLDTVPLYSLYQQAVNNYRSAQAAADNVLDQVKDHSEDETFSQRATRTAAEVARDNAYDAMIAAGSNLRNATIFAPFNGIMDTVNPASPGINVLPTSVNYTILNPSTVYFESEVEETDLPGIKVGQKAQIVLDAYPDEIIQTTVESIGVVAFTSGTGGNAYRVRLSLPENTDVKFKVGMQGDVEIIYNTVTDVTTINSTAVVSDGVGYYVWKVENNKAKKVEIQIGEESSQKTRVVSGIGTEDVIIDQPPVLLKDGTKVSVSD